MALSARAPCRHKPSRCRCIRSTSPRLCRPSWRKTLEPIPSEALAMNAADWACLIGAFFACPRINDLLRSGYSVHYRHGFVLTYPFFDSGLCDCQAFIVHDCFGYKSIKRDRAKEPSESK
jgi:hypothetical protein